MLFVEMNRETVRFDDNHLEKALKVLRNGDGDDDNGEKVQFFLEVCEFQLYSTIGIYRRQSRKSEILLLYTMACIYRGWVY